jgi:hypothetical protein
MLFGPSLIARVKSHLIQNVLAIISKLHEAQFYFFGVYNFVPSRILGLKYVHHLNLQFSY